MGVCRSSHRWARAAPRSAVAELGVVRRFYTSPMNEAATSPLPSDASSERDRSRRFSFRRLFVWLAAFVIAFVLYALSLGPVLHFYGARVGGGWASLPPVVRVIYAPLQVVGGWLPMAYEHYIYSWLIEPPARSGATP